MPVSSKAQKKSRGKEHTSSLSLESILVILQIPQRGRVKGKWSKKCIKKFGSCCELLLPSNKHVQHCKISVKAQPSHNTSAILHPSFFWFCCQARADKVAVLHPALQGITQQPCRPQLSPAFSQILPFLHLLH